ncbi:MAG: hypothetical protein JNM18_11875 [Planctomycetaceae bacterium]|nr:hypothetical protein [Planctomycetaceae bacterium]
MHAVVVDAEPSRASSQLSRSHSTRRGWRTSLLIALAVLVGWGGYFLPPALYFLSYRPQDGDVVFQSLPRSPLTNMIEGATQSPYSHCGMVVQENGRWVVYEAIGDVHRTPLATWFWRSRGYCFAAYRLNTDEQTHVGKMVEYCRVCLGLPYDLRYEMDDEKIYCSELVSKAYRHSTARLLGDVVRVADLDWKPYEAQIKQLNGGTIPLDRELITPRDLAAAKELELVSKYRH